MAHQFSGCIYGFGGDLQAALAVQSQAARIDPAYVRTDVVEADMGLWRLLMGEFDEARGHLDKALAANPKNLRARQRMVALLGSQGECEAARSELEDLVALGGPLTAEYVTASYPFQQAEHARLFASGLRRAGAPIP
jgi:tetratricopeptide (TPR) repeat protein